MMAVLRTGEPQKAEPKARPAPSRAPPPRQPPPLAEPVDDGGIEDRRAAEGGTDGGQDAEKDVKVPELTGEIAQGSRQSQQKDADDHHRPRFPAVDEGAGDGRG